MAVGFFGASEFRFTGFGILAQTLNSTVEDSKLECRKDPGLVVVWGL